MDWLGNYLVLYLLLYLRNLSYGKTPDVGTCTFEGKDDQRGDNGLCGYAHIPLADGEEFFNWELENGVGSSYMNVNIEDHFAGQKARLYSPEITQQDTHCFSFEYHMEGGISSNGSIPPSSLNVYLLDEENTYIQHPVWKSSVEVGRSGWTTVQLALNPTAYQVVFEAVISQPIPGVIALDNILVTSEACKLAPHFLRVSDKEVNLGQNMSIQCLLWGQNMAEFDRNVKERTNVIMQKSNGDEFRPSSRKVYQDHLSVIFSFKNVNLEESGMYRCVARNATVVGVSNFATVAVKTPPIPQRPPEVMTLGSSHLKINLNSKDFAGDMPIVRTILQYRPTSGSWSDGQYVTSPTYHLWHLQPDTEYELRVVLVRPGTGGAGIPGPALNIETSCGVPLSAVQNVKISPTSSTKLKITWDEPDFRITQCHFYTYDVKYRQFDPKSTPVESNAVIQYDTMEVKSGNKAVILGLTPFTMYKIKIGLTNSEGSVETGEFTAMTGEAAPGPIAANSFKVIGKNETSIAVKWDKPKITNGVLTKYEVAFRGLSSFEPDFIPQEEKGLFQIRAEELNLTLDNLHPGTNYTLSIRAKTAIGFGPAVEITASTEIAPPKMPVYPSNATNGDLSSSPTTIEINVFPAEANGAPISHYYIIIEEVPEDNVGERPSGRADTNSDTERSKSPKPNRKKKKNKKRDKRSALSRNSGERIRNRRQLVVSTSDKSTACEATPLSYEESKKQNKTFYFGGQLDPKNVTEDTKFIVGADSTSGGFSNPPLDPTKKYNIYVRVDSTVGNITRINCALAAVKSKAPVSTTAATTTSPATLTPLIVLSSINNLSDKNNPSSESVPTSNGDAGQQTDNGKVMMYASIGGGIAGFLILVVIVILILIQYRKHKDKGKQKEEVVNPFEVRMMMSDMSGGGTERSMARSDGSPDRQALMMPDVVGFEHHANHSMGYYFDKSADAASNSATGLYGAPSTPMGDERLALRVDDFHIHVNQMKQQNSFGFHDEFATFHDGQTASWKVAEREENRPKNRYGNIMAYDHSRVILEPPKGYEGETDSDYINANYVIGYKTPSMYIATQAPCKESIIDFWLMVWQEKSQVIVMLTNLVELGKRKCQKYWPDDSDQYGSIKVSLTDTEELCDYTIRTFVIQQDNDYDVREVKQFHFTAWPDHGVPSKPTNILSFIRRVKSYEPPGQGPTTAHCSAGSGRTGCFIVIDMMLDMAREEGLISIYNAVRDLRTRRVNMVQTEEQYIFIHEAVLEALLCGDTLVNAPDLRQHYDDLITVDQHTQIAPVQEEFETLNVMTPKLTDEECSVARLPRNRQRNRFMDVLPADSQMPYLVTPHPSDPESNYINAVFVDSYSRRNAFLVTQMPLPNTVIDYWRLVYDYNCTSMIMMHDVSGHDETCCQYWPDKGSMIFGPFTVELLRQEDEVDVITRLFKLQNVNRASEGFRIVQQFQLTNWPASQPVPFTRNAVLRMIQLVNKWQDECATTGDERMLVHCIAGAGRSGTFMACYNMCTQLRQEYAVDVFNIVQRLRNIRPQLVETLEQYRFCYEVGWDFADQ